MAIDLPHIYAEKIAAGTLIPDPGQAPALAALQELCCQLEKPVARSWFRAGPAAPRGVYLYGPVGRGKSMLMDLFYSQVPVAKKRRVHFHAFMLEVHEGDLGHYLPDHQQALGTLAQNAVGYLNSLRPNSQKMAPLDSKPVASQASEMEFMRQLANAQQPMMLLQHIGQGTLLPQDLKTVNTIYPGYVQKVSQKLTSEMLNSGKNVPYGTRMSLSMLMGQPLDSTMTPQAIVAAQPVPSQPPPQAPHGGKTKHSTSKLGGIAASAQTPGQARLNEKSNPH